MLDRPAIRSSKRQMSERFSRVPIIMGVCNAKLPVANSRKEQKHG